MHKKILLLVMVSVIFSFHKDSLHLVHAAETDLHVHFINVGQGDSILIETPDNRHILMDGGPPNAGGKVVDYLKEEDVHEIDLLIATHPDIDHIGGLVDVLQEFPVKHVLDIGKVHPTKTYMRYTYELFKQKVPLLIAEENEDIGGFESVDMRVLNAYHAHDTNNEASIVLKLSYGKLDFLFMGDVGKEEELRLLDAGDPTADIIKIGHHGSKTSTSLAFLESISPSIAFLTYSKDNDYGHPVDDVIANLHTIGTQIFSTAVYGDMVIQTDGEDYIVLPERSPMEGVGPETGMD